MRRRRLFPVERKMLDRAMRSLGIAPEPPSRRSDPRCPKRLYPAEKKMLQIALKRLA